MRPSLPVAGLAALTACAPPSRSAGAFAADPEAARRVVAVCDRGRAHPERGAARAGLAEARRRERMAVCETVF